MHSGTLQMKISTAEGTIPVAGAAVKVSDAIGRVVQTLSTDVSGMTAVITLYAPKRELSMNPYTSHLAYSLYEVMVTHTGFIPHIVRGVSVFEGEGSILPVDLVPRTSLTEWGDAINVIDLSPPRASAPMHFPPPGMLQNR